MSDNLSLWDSVRTVDPKYTKPISGKGYKGTSTNFTYLAKRATETFGPCGIGWGWIVTSERMERLTDVVILHIANVTFWYVQDGKRGEVPHIGQTFAVSKNGHPDEDAPKKSVTDAVTKAMACVGFAADIHMGMYDDNKYVDQVTAEFRAQDASNAPSITEDQYAVLTELIRATGTNVSALLDHYKIKAVNQLPASEYGGLEKTLKKRLDALPQKEAA